MSWYRKIYQRTALHYACDRYNPSDQKTIDICVMLIDKGADPSALNEDGQTPLDIIGGGLYNVGSPKYKISDKEAAPIKRAIERQEYHRLEEGTKPVPVKLFLLGDIAAGKSTLKKSLVENEDQEPQPHDPTPGIDVRTYDVNGVGTVSVWDAAGHIEYHITHGMFLGHQNSMVVLLYDIREGDGAKERLEYWLKFLRCGNQPDAKSKLKVLILATHLDEVSDIKAAQGVARMNLQAMKDDFGDALDIFDAELMVNARHCHSKEMQELREVLNSTLKEIQGTRKLPRLCERILEQKEQWMTTKSCILRYDDYKDRVKALNSQITDDFVRISVNYLSDMGEVFLARDASNNEYVVLDTRWLSYHIIGPTFAGVDFKDQLKRLPTRPSYTRRELEDYYGEVADFTTLALLLQSLELMVPLKDGCSYMIPAKLSPAPIEETASDLTNGRCIICVDKTMFAPLLFPAVQARIVQDPTFKGSEPRVFSGHLEFEMEAEGSVWLRNTKDAINFAVKGVANNAEKCHGTLERVNQMLVLALNELSPGTKTATGYLSPFSLQEHRVEHVAYYTMEEIKEGDNRQDDSVPRNETISKKITKREKTTDVLIAGFDPHFIRRKGVQCKYHWMLQQRKIFSLLDDPNSLRTDYRSLAQLLQVDERECPSSAEAIIKHWCEKTGKTMTLGLLLTMFRHPGLVGNEEAADILEQMLKQNGHRGPFPLCDVKMVSGNFPEDLILWRAVLRKTHTVLQEEIESVNVIIESLRSSKTLTAKDRDEINMKARNEGNAEAVSLLVSKCISLRDPGWPGKFLDALKPHHPHVVNALTNAEETLKNDILASVQASVEDGVRSSSAPEQAVVGVSDTDISDIIDTLLHADLLNLYGALGLTTKEIEDAETSSVERSLHQKAKYVLENWRDKKAEGATRPAVLDALTKCNNIEAREKLQALWCTVSTKDLTDVTELLKGHQMQMLYTKLGLSESEIGESESRDDTWVLEYWCKNKGQAASRRALLEALQLCGKDDVREELQRRWIIKDMASDSDLKDVCKLLGPSELKHLYGELNLSNQDVEKGEKRADSKDTNLMAKCVLEFWRQVNGQAATRQSLLAALGQCRFNSTKEELEKKWSIKGPTVVKPRYTRQDLPTEKEASDTEQTRSKTTTDSSEASSRTSVEQRKKPSELLKEHKVKSQGPTEVKPLYTRHYLSTEKEASDTELKRKSKTTTDSSEASSRICCCCS